MGKAAPGFQPSLGSVPRVKGNKHRDQLYRHAFLSHSQRMQVPAPVYTPRDTGKQGWGAAWLAGPGGVLGQLLAGALGHVCWEG